MKCTRLLALASAELALLLTVPLAHAQFTDHLKCHKLKDAKSFIVKATADFTAIQPAFSATGCVIKKAKYFCVPSTKENVQPPPSGPDVKAQALSDDYICYDTKCPKIESVVLPQLQEVTDQFGIRNQTKYKTSLLCVPAVKGGPCRAPVSRLINTGASTSLIGPNTVDNVWTLVTAPIGAYTGPALVIPPQDSWGAPLPSSSWISSGVGSQLPAVDPTYYVYQTCWNLCDAPGNISLNVRVDDQADFKLNGYSFGSSVVGPTGSGTAVNLSAGSGLFKVGINCLQIFVQNAGSSESGLDLTGSVTSQ